MEPGSGLSLVCLVAPAGSDGFSFEARETARAGLALLARKGNVVGLERARRRFAELDPEATRDEGTLAGSLI